MTGHLLKGFSGKSKLEKLNTVSEKTGDPASFAGELKSFWHQDPNVQKIFDEISENTISNYYLPFGVAPNFLINEKTFMVPMVTEESSVIAAASGSARFWYERGGFISKVISTEKTGQLFFTWTGDPDLLKSLENEIFAYLISHASDITRTMEKRGGGIRKMTVINMKEGHPPLFQMKVSFDTVDSMGANFINSCLESFGSSMKQFFSETETLQGEDFEIIMAILSNYTPECLVECSLQCRTSEFTSIVNGMSPGEFLRRFQTAVRIAEIDPHRAATHNKGIFNGIDAVVLATGNDFRAVEAGGHAYAARSGTYSSLTALDISDDTFCYSLKVPLSLGTVGGLTVTHPLARRAMEIMGNPDARKLMEITAAAGLANNFAAIRSLVTTGIQKGHMKMHLSNILNSLDASASEQEAAGRYFSDKLISHHAVVSYLKTLRD